jgi:hypothetical protein
LIGGVTYLLAFYVPDALTRHNANPAVVSAWISGGATFLGVVATAAVAIFAFWYARSTNQATIDTANANLKDQGKQLDKTLAEQRTRTLNERFATAASQLGSDKPPAVRLAGVYAMAGLADDWKENRHTCINVLCAYLRLPYEAGEADQQVRRTVIQVIGQHLRGDDPDKSWQGYDLNFDGAVFNGGDPEHSYFSDFEGARFSGGTVSFRHATFSGGRLSFRDAVFSGSRVTFRGAVFGGGRVSFGDAKFAAGTVTFARAQFAAGTVNFKGAKIVGGEVDFSSAKFSGSRVPFGDAQFSGGKVNFGDAQFSGGKVDFSGAAVWSCPPEFPWPGTPPPSVKLPSKQDQSTPKPA